MCYNLKRDELLAGMTSFKSSTFTQLPSMAANLHQSLLDVRAILEAGGKAKL